VEHAFRQDRNELTPGQVAWTSQWRPTMIGTLFDLVKEMAAEAGQAQS